MKLTVQQTAIVLVSTFLSSGKTRSKVSKLALSKLANRKIRAAFYTQLKIEMDDLGVEIFELGDNGGYGLIKHTCFDGAPYLTLPKWSSVSVAGIVAEMAANIEKITPNLYDFEPDDF